jgi:hypothetical protein
MSGFAHRASLTTIIVGEPVAKYINKDILRNSVNIFPANSAGPLGVADLLRQMYSSHIPLIEAILRDDVAAFSIWSVDHPDFEVEFDGRCESALT